MFRFSHFGSSYEGFPEKVGYDCDFRMEYREKSGKGDLAWPLLVVATTGDSREGCLGLQLRGGVASGVGYDYALRIPPRRRFQIR